MAKGTKAGELFEDAAATSLSSSVGIQGGHEGLRNGRGDWMMLGGRGKGREIDEIPLCAKCAEETEAEAMDEDRVVPLALKRIDRYDGGLCRRRWEATHALNENPEWTPIPRDDTSGSVETLRQSQGSQSKASSHGPIYVSIDDPIGKPAFRPSRTKPIPAWMQLLPSQRQSKDYKSRPISVLDKYFNRQPQSPNSVETQSEGLSPSAPTERSPSPPRQAEEQSHTPELTGLPLPSAGPETGTARFQMSRPFTLISDEPVRRPSSRLTHHPKAVHFLPSEESSVGSALEKVKSPEESTEFLKTYHPHRGNYSNVVPSSIAGRLSSGGGKAHVKGMGTSLEATLSRNLSQKSSDASLATNATADSGKRRTGVQDQLKRLFGF